MKLRGTLWYRFCRAFVRWIVYPALGGLRVVGAQRIPKDGPLIFAPIHFSVLDPPLVAAGSDRAISFMAKIELFSPTWQGALIRSLGAFPVERGSSDSEAIRLALRLLEEGRALLLFPEGTRGDGETLGPIGAGVTMLARRTGAVVVPVGISGTQRVLPKGAKSLRRARMTLVFGEPFSYQDLVDRVGEKEAKAAFALEIQERLLALTAQAGLTLKKPPSSRGLPKSDRPAPSTPPVDCAAE